MNLIQLNEIIQELREYSPRKSKRLERLAEVIRTETKEEKKKRLEKKIYDYVYQIFLSCLSRKSREDLAYINAIIDDECFQLEYREKNRYHIGFEGVKRKTQTDEKNITKSYIKREYQKGFFINPSVAEKTPEEQKELLAQSTFYYDNINTLNEISGYMDHKLELITYEYTLKDSRIKREFTEHLISFLGLSRIENGKEKPTEKYPKKVKR